MLCFTNQPQPGGTGVWRRREDRQREREGNGWRRTQWCSAQLPVLEAHGETKLGSDFCTINICEEKRKQMFLF